MNKKLLTFIVIAGMIATVSSYDLELSATYNKLNIKSSDYIDDFPGSSNGNDKILPDYFTKNAFPLYHEVDFVDSRIDKLTLFDSIYYPKSFITEYIFTSFTL